MTENLKTGDKVRIDSAQGTALGFSKDFSQVAVKWSGGLLELVPYNQLSLVPDTVTVEIERSVAIAILTGSSWYEALQEACRKALGRP